MKESQGIQRLASFLGGIGAFTWLFFVAIYNTVFSTIHRIDFDLEFWLTLGITVPCFLIPFGIVHGIAWVVRGFKEDKKNHGND